MFVYIFIKKLIFICYKSFWYIDFKNNFKNIKKYIILIYFKTKKIFKKITINIIANQPSIYPAWQRLQNNLEPLTEETKKERE